MTAPVVESPRFVTFEGIDGCGKSTQADLLKSFLEGNEQTVILVREPGGTGISEKIRTLLLDPENKGMDPVTESLLLAASRTQLVNQVILPAIRDGKTVLCDRFVDSTLAYQGHGRGLPLEWLEMINEYATRTARPDATVFVDVPVNTALERMEKKTFDRMEKEGHDFLERVREGYLRLAEKDPRRYIVVNGLESIQEIHKKIVRRMFHEGSFPRAE
ncbi:MAG: dTMP kinase [Fidelibacterota bacterium]